jgi:hypothetical protein
MPSLDRCRPRGDRCRGGTHRRCAGHRPPDSSSPCLTCGERSWRFSQRSGSPSLLPSLCEAAKPGTATSRAAITPTAAATSLFSSPCPSFGLSYRWGTTLPRGSRRGAESIAAESIARSVEERPAAAFRRPPERRRRLHRPFRGGDLAGVGGVSTVRSGGCPPRTDARPVGGFAVASGAFA